MLQGLTPTIYQSPRITRDQSHDLACSSASHRSSLETTAAAVAVNEEDMGSVCRVAENESKVDSSSNEANGTKECDEKDDSGHV